MVKEKIRKIEIGEREKKVINFISYGYTDEEIAEELTCSRGTVRGVLGYLYCKTNTLNKHHLVGWAFRNKVIN